MAAGKETIYSENLISAQCNLDQSPAPAAGVVSPRHQLLGWSIISVYWIKIHGLRKM
jgi:hypothetical protein